MPGKVNRFQVRPTELGTFQGKCAELCGAYHSAMLFQVKVVSQAAYDAHLAALKAKGHVGMLDNSLNREKIQPGNQQYASKEGGQLMPSGERAVEDRARPTSPIARPNGGQVGHHDRSQGDRQPVLPSPCSASS